MPEPAPASTRQGLSRCCTAAIWAGFMVGAESEEGGIKEAEQASGLAEALG